MAMFALSIHHYGFHNNGVGAGGARPIVVEAAEAAYIMADGKAANIAIQPIPNDSLTTYYIYIYIDCISF